MLVLPLFEQVEDLSNEPQVERELMLVKVHADPQNRTEVPTEKFLGVVCMHVLCLCICIICSYLLGFG